MSDMADRVDRERVFYDTKSDRFDRLRELIWRAIGEFNRNEEITELYDPRGKRVLLYGCGPALGSKDFVEAGASEVVGIDISAGEIEYGQQVAAQGGYADRVDLKVADAHHTGLPDRSFDLIMGTAILHHLDVRLALAELRRLLAPNGRAVFLEPLAHNPILRVGRRLTPSARTDDEHPFTVEDWRLCAEAFPGFWHREAELTSIPLMPLSFVLPRAWQRGLADRAGAFDDRLLARYPGLGRYARTTTIVLE
ncbi:MAG TPA: class I SAM-dependent methyltransferase [Solirubrobacteraceae bacterium]|nr:class I SAM-dependent methyltransferase [Solirubrobacteraceae bacterium]